MKKILQFLFGKSFEPTTLSSTNPLGDPENFIEHPGVSSWGNDTFCPHCMARVTTDDVLNEICPHCGRCASILHYRTRSYRKINTEQGMRWQYNYRLFHGPNYWEISSCSPTTPRTKEQKQTYRDAYEEAIKPREQPKSQS